MPALGADMEQGTLLEWLVHPGDTVHRGDIVAVVDTAKAAVEVECFVSGVVEQLLVEPGARVPVGAPLATITGAGAPPPAVPPPEPFPPLRHLARQYHVNLAAVHGTGPDGRVTHEDVERAAAPRRRASPLARRIATELGVDLGTVTGTGPGGAIDAGDVRHAATTRIAEPAAPCPPGPSDRTAAMRAAVAALMARSKREIPHYYLTESVDLGHAVDWLTARNRQLPVPRRLVPAALLLKAAAVAATKVPDVNGFWVDDHFAPAAAVHLGVAVSLRGGGLVAPAIHDADTLDLDQLMARLRDLVTRARAGKLRRTELSDPSLTVSNLGDQGVDSITGVIYPPQVALVGFGKVADRPVAVAGLIGIRPTVTATLAADHRATDGATGARYLHTIAQLLQSPEDL